jgi:hypothetical protein
VGSPTVGGQLVVELEIARGEVMAVNLGGDHFPEAFISCAADVAFAMTTPTYELGGQPDTIFVIRKPITFRAPVTAAKNPRSRSTRCCIRPPTQPAALPSRSSPTSRSELPTANRTVTRDTACGWRFPQLRGEVLIAHAHTPGSRGSGLPARRVRRR